MTILTPPRFRQIPVCSHSHTHRILSREPSGALGELGVWRSLPWVSHSIHSNIQTSKGKKTQKPTKGFDFRFSGWINKWDSPPRAQQTNSAELPSKPAGVWYIFVIPSTHVPLVAQVFPVQLQLLPFTAPAVSANRGTDLAPATLPAGHSHTPQTGKGETQRSSLKAPGKVSTKIQVFSEHSECLWEQFLPFGIFRCYFNFLNSKLAWCYLNTPLSPDIALQKPKLYSHPVLAKSLKNPTTSKDNAES